MADDSELKRRIRDRAYQIWLDEGQPEGRETEHWDLATLAIAQQDAQSSMLKPVEPPGPEPIEAVENQGEFPTLTDQGEQINPNR